jgi:hypothetical protein
LLDVGAFNLTPEPAEFESLARSFDDRITNEAGIGESDVSDVEHAAQDLWKAAADSGELLTGPAQALGQVITEPLAMPAGVDAEGQLVDAAIQDAAERLPAEAWDNATPPPAAVETLAPSPEAPTGSTVPAPLETIPLE